MYGILHLVYEIAGVGIRATSVSVATTSIPRVRGIDEEVDIAPGPPVDTDEGSAPTSLCNTDAGGGNAGNMQVSTYKCRDTEAATHLWMMARTLSRFY